MPENASASCLACAWRATISYVCSSLSGTRCSPRQPSLASAIANEASPGAQIARDHPGLHAQGLFERLNEFAGGAAFPDLSGPDMRPLRVVLILMQERHTHPIECAKKRALVRVLLIPVAQDKACAVNLDSGWGRR